MKTLLINNLINYFKKRENCQNFLENLQTAYQNQKIRAKKKNFKKQNLNQNL